MARIDHRHVQAHGLQCARQSRLITSGGLHHHQAHIHGLQGSSQRTVAISIVGKPLDIAVGAQYTDIDVCLGHVNTYRH